MEIQHKNFNIVGTRKYWYILSTVLILPGIISLAVWHLNVGIDFKGGSFQQIHFDQRPTIDTLRTEVGKSGVNGVSVQTIGDQDASVKFPVQEGVVARAAGDKILSSIGETHKEVAFQSISESVSKSTKTNAIWSVILASLAIILFIAWSFGSVPKPASSWRFGLTAIVALAHDLLFVVGAFSIIGHFFPTVEVDALFITALLTIVGYSVNDTIVVFDRIRENLRRTPGKDFSEIANNSLNQTLARSLNTSLTVLIVLCSLLLLGGESIRNFILAMTLGVAIGTYSSIFNASPLLVSWQYYAMARQAIEDKKNKKK